MTHKTALVSGGTDGVGLSVVKALMKEAYDVYFIGSNSEKGRAVERQLKAELASHINTDSYTKSFAENSVHVEFIHLDLSDLVAVKKFTDAFLAKVNHLDILCLSAGVLLTKRTESIHGIEKTLSVGYLSAYLLSHSLLPLLEKADQARVITVAGDASLVLKERLDFENFNYENSYNGFSAAANTVHAKAVLSQILAEQWADKGIMSNTLHPGMVKSSLGRDLPWPINTLAKLVAQCMSNDSKTAINVCLSHNLLGVTAKHFNKHKQVPLQFSDNYQEKLIERTKAILDKVMSH